MNNELSIRNYFSKQGRQKLEKTKAIAKLYTTRKSLTTGGTEMAVAHTRLTETSERIDVYIDMVEKQDLTVFKKKFDTYDLDSEYADKLKNEMEEVRKQSLATLVPLKTKTEKLRAHMYLSTYKVNMWAKTIECQAKVADAAHIQVDTLRELKETGDGISNEIEDILTQCEELNNASSNTLKTDNFTFDAAFVDLTPKPDKIEAKNV